MKSASATIKSASTTIKSVSGTLNSASAIMRYAFGNIHHHKFKSRPPTTEECVETDPRHTPFGGASLAEGLTKVADRYQTVDLNMNRRHPLPDSLLDNFATLMQDCNKLATGPPQQSSHCPTVLTSKFQSLHAAIRTYSAAFEVSAGVFRSAVPVHVDQLKTVFLPALLKTIVRLNDILLCGGPGRADGPSCNQLALRTLLDAEQTINQIEALMGPLWTAVHEEDHQKAQDLSALSKFLVRKTGLVDVEKHRESVWRQVDVVEPVRGDRSVRISALNATCARARADIQGFIQWLDLSDFRVLQDVWQSKLYDELHKAATQALPATFREFQETDEHHVFFRQTFPDCILVVRLLEILIRKLAGPDNKELAQMPTAQHTALLRAISPMARGLASLLDDMDSITYGADFRPRPAAAVAANVARANKVFMQYFDLQQPQPLPDHRSGMAFRDWWMSWNRLFDLALARFHDSHYQAFLKLASVDY
ncbi:hypothetical protein PTTG_05162 [Puccinia triticina 1-1 BBBD Race 1]|uniref:Uncharacterized protein n=1 Tax=Puccinia triticina (isolate 1-1 / race 1 (BBBD)) TaxID=630390 RepID=A0A0C4EWG7_PUCT1|nr:hypothetical protein PTTG_05162 [Puccinia triticina 1-1 BBBD Race 1]